MFNPWKDPLEEEMATHSSIFAWIILYLVVQSMGSNTDTTEHTQGTTWRSFKLPQFHGLF